MKTVYIEKAYKELAEGERFWSTQEDCEWIVLEKWKTESGWEWFDGSVVVHDINPDRIVWVEIQYKEWPEYLIPMSCAAIAILTIAFFCYAIMKG